MANTIHLRGDRDGYDEGVAEEVILPGMVIETHGVDSDGRPRVRKHATDSGPTELAVVWEDGIRGMTVDGDVQGTTDLGYQTGDLVRYCRYETGDAVQLLLEDGENAAVDSWLCSSGNGLVKVTTDPEGDNAFAKAEQALNLTGAPTANGLIEARIVRAV